MEAALKLVEEAEEVIANALKIGEIGSNRFQGFNLEPSIANIMSEEEELELLKISKKLLKQQRIDKFLKIGGIVGGITTGGGIVGLGLGVGGYKIIKKVISNKKTPHETLKRKHYMS